MKYIKGTMTNLRFQSHRHVNRRNMVKGVKHLPFQMDGCIFAVRYIPSYPSHVPQRWIQPIILIPIPKDRKKMYRLTVKHCNWQQFAAPAGFQKCKSSQRMTYY